MAKRELIERENLINELTESSKHHAQTSREESLLYRDRQIVREQPTITEQDIVKPVLDKIRAEIFKVESDCRLSIDEYPSCKQCTDNVFGTIYRILDKYKAESEET